MAWIWRILAWLYAFAPQHRLWAIACQQIEWVCDTVYGGHEISEEAFFDTLDRLEWAEWAASHYAPKHLRQTLLAAWTRGDAYEVIVERIRMVLDILSTEPGRAVGLVPTPFVRLPAVPPARQRAPSPAPAPSPLSPPPLRRALHAPARGPPSPVGCMERSAMHLTFSPRTNERSRPQGLSRPSPANAAARALARGRRGLGQRMPTRVKRIFSVRAISATSSPSPALRA